MDPGWLRQLSPYPLPAKQDREKNQKGKSKENIDSLINEGKGKKKPQAT